MLAIAGDAARHAFLWENGVMTDLGTLGGSFSVPIAINESGQVVGRMSSAGDVRAHAFLWHNGVLSNLGTLGGSYSEALAINESGQVVGWSITTGDEAARAFLCATASNADKKSVTANPGESSAVSTAPTTTGEAGVSATLTNNTAGSGAATLTVERFFDTNPGTTHVVDIGGQYVDLHVDGADPSDIVTASFYYPTTVTGVAEAELQLLYFTGVIWDAVRSSGNTEPLKDTTDNLDNTVSGGRFQVTLDASSTPQVTELTGTVFTATVSPLVGVRVLQERVSALSLHDGQRQSLVSKLHAAERSLMQGHTKTAANQLRAFRNEVQAMRQTGRLPTEAADALLRLAHSIGNTLGAR